MDDCEESSCGGSLCGFFRGSRTKGSSSKQGNEAVVLLLVPPHLLLAAVIFVVLFMLLFVCVVVQTTNKNGTLMSFVRAYSILSEFQKNVSYIIFTLLIFRIVK